jgi:hypothetical protein
MLNTTHLTSDLDTVLCASPNINGQAAVHRPRVNAAVVVRRDLPVQGHERGLIQTTVLGNEPTTVRYTASALEQETQTKTQSTFTSAMPRAARNQHPIQPLRVE